MTLLKTVYTTLRTPDLLVAARAAFGAEVSLAGTPNCAPVAPLGLWPYSAETHEIVGLAAAHRSGPTFTVVRALPELVEHPSACFGGLPLKLEVISIEDLAAWFEVSWSKVSAPGEVLREDRGLGSDDCPHLTLVERSYTPEHEVAFGAWGASREVQWEWHGGKAGRAGMCRMTAEFCAGFCATNGRIALALRGPREAAAWRAVTTATAGKPGAHLDWGGGAAPAGPGLLRCAAWLLRFAETYCKTHAGER